MTDAGKLSFTKRLSLFTPVVFFLTIYLSLATLNFGYDVGSFAGVQALTPFAKRFGHYDQTSETWALPSYLASLMNSLPFIGKLIGALTCGPIAEKYGRRVAVAVMACISLVGVTLQTSATTAAQFTLGRIINFAMTGFCIVVTPIYQSECSPPALRGMISSTIQFQILLGQVISSLVNLGTSHMDTDSAWQIPVGLQFVVPAFMLGLLPFMPESPRWLVSKGRLEQALHCLSRLRNKEADDPMISEEIRNLQHDHSNESKGRWKELFDDANRTRTWIAILVMFFQQITGQAFVSQYSVSFYKSQKIGDPFLLNVLQNIVSMICNMITFTYVDSLGRRPLLLVGSFLMASFLIALGGLATTPRPSESQKNAMAASMMIAFGFYGLSWAPISYIVLGEVSNSRVKEKTSNLAVSISVITTFIVSFTVPYLINAPYANLGGKVGFLYGGITFVSVAVAYFYVPELKGLSLEEVDRLFATGRPVRRLSGRMLTLAHDDDTAMNKP
ncbi:hypothetical protein HFD88_000434 [Aspergillus terreus]|nr:hypothetical protein HFD88_000434 [Aspergillus terreus]